MHVQQGGVSSGGIRVHGWAGRHARSTRLLDAICELAQQAGYTSVRLDVIDTIPRARALYERKGFVPTEQHRYPWLKPVFGFGGHTTLVKSLASHI